MTEDELREQAKNIIDGIVEICQVEELNNQQTIDTLEYIRVAVDNKLAELRV